jgi:hypothetical protein
LELASNSPSARMPVSEVRMSWAKAASAASVVRVAGPRRGARRRERLAADFFLGLFRADFDRTMAAPRRAQNDTAADQTKQAPTGLSKITR